MSSPKPPTPDINFQQRDAEALPWTPEKCHKYADVRGLRDALRDRFIRDLGHKGIVPDSVEVGTEYRRNWIPDEKPTVVAIDFVMLDGDVLYNGRFTGAGFIEYRVFDDNAITGDGVGSYEAPQKVQCLMSDCTEYVNSIVDIVVDKMAQITKRKLAEADEPALIVEAKLALHEFRTVLANNAVSSTMLKDAKFGKDAEVHETVALERITKVTEAYRVFCKKVDGSRSRDYHHENLWSIFKAGESLNKEYMTGAV